MCRIPNGGRLIKYTPTAATYTFSSSSKKLLLFGSKPQLPVSFPQTLTTLVLHSKTIPSSLPISLTHLTLGNKFNQHLNKTLSCLHLLTHLTLGKEFNQLIDFFPPSLTCLAFGKKFNQPINNLPSNLTNLIVGKNFNQAVEKLPPSLAHLTIGSLKFSTIQSKFKHSLDPLPHSLTHLTIFVDLPILHLPPNLTHLTLENFFDQPGKPAPSHAYPPHSRVLFQP